MDELVFLSAESGPQQDFRQLFGLGMKQESSASPTMATRSATSARLAHLVTLGQAMMAAGMVVLFLGTPFASLGWRSLVARTVARKCKVTANRRNAHRPELRGKYQQQQPINCNLGPDKTHRVALAVARHPLDPVCGMRIDPATAPTRLRHHDRDWRFCSTTCAHRFTAVPTRYTGQPQHGRTEQETQS
ncbi:MULTISPECIES: YHS domain-containing protein [Mycobacterium]|uniref:YHS domain-containing protein n=1 Tax=Mycobacterium TaxID=1763 RepID=UPI001EE2826A|nr:MULTISPECIES: YHS domain-containing protein [Mycobacterium]